MEIAVAENGIIQLGKVFNPIQLITEAGEVITITMRDSGFEFYYYGKWYSAKNGIVGAVKLPEKTESVDYEQSFLKDE